MNMYPWISNTFPLYSLPCPNGYDMQRGVLPEGVSSVWLLSCNTTHVIVNGPPVTSDGLDMDRDYNVAINIWDTGWRFWGLPREALVFRLGSSHFTFIRIISKWKYREIYVAERGEAPLMKRNIHNSAQCELNFGSWAEWYAQFPALSFL